MKIPTLAGLIDRRILVNYRVDPERLAKILPSPFEPQLVAGWGVAGICLIRLKRVRPRWVPPFVGLASENAAHRIAVEWTAPDGSRQSGVYIPRRDTSSFLNHLVGGRLFPGVHHHARFDVRESGRDYRIAVQSRDGQTRVFVEGHVADELPSDSIFASLDATSRFFECGSLGYSPCAKPGVFDGLELRTHDWNVRPLAVTRVESSFFDDRRTFPEGAAQFDCALLMTGVRHEWHSRERVCTEVGSACRAEPSAREKFAVG